jgi:hypothetical protein
MVTVHRENIRSVDLQVNRIRRRPDHRPHPAIADRLPRIRRFRRPVADQIGTTDNGLVIDRRWKWFFC